MTKLFEDEDWYIDRPEAELEWQGILQRRDTVTGPASRTSAGYALRSDDGNHVVYAPNIDFLLASYLGTRVVVRAKLVDLSGEGYTKELWLASIQSVD